MTDSAYPKLTQAQKTFQDLVYKPMINAGLTALFIDQPWLNVWGIRQIVTVGVHRASEWAYNGLRLAIDIGAIKLVNADHERAFNTASVTLKVVAANHGIDSDEFRKANENAKNALAKFVRFGATL